MVWLFRSKRDSGWISIWGAVHHPWGGDFDAPLIGCKFHDANYSNHTGFDSPVSVGTSVTFHDGRGGGLGWIHQRRLGTLGGG
jgi:hypothetical protein